MEDRGRNGSLCSSIAEEWDGGQADLLPSREEIPQSCRCNPKTPHSKHCVQVSGTKDEVGGLQVIWFCSLCFRNFP